MGATYRMVNRGYPWKTITHGRANVGRVVKHATESGYVGVIGTLSARGATEAEAFHEVAARALGFESAAALRNRNQEVHQHNAARRADQRRRFAPAKRAIESGDVQGFIRELDKLIDGGKL